MTTAATPTKRKRVPKPPVVGEVLQGEVLPPLAAESAPAPQPTELARIFNENGLDVESANSLQNAFAAMFGEAEKWRTQAMQIVVSDVCQTREMKLAREARLALKDIRVRAEHTRKQLKEDSLRRGRAIDGIANVLKFLIEPAEKHLLDQEQFAERKEAEKLAKLQEERAAQLAPFEEEGSAPIGDLSRMTDEQFDALLSGTKQQFEARQEAARKSEEERLVRERAEAEEREWLRLENERLKAEAREREEEARQERLRQQALREVERQKAEAAERKAAAERAVLEAQRRAAEEAEAARRDEEEAARLRAAQAPDKDKLRALAEMLRDLPLPDLESVAAQTIAKEYLHRTDALLEWLEEEIAKL
jgi:hypothetical protein